MNRAGITPAQVLSYIEHHQPNELNGRGNLKGMLINDIATGVGGTRSQVKSCLRILTKDHTSGLSYTSRGYRVVEAKGETVDEARWVQENQKQIMGVVTSCAHVQISNKAQAKAAGRLISHNLTPKEIEAAKQSLQQGMLFLTYAQAHLQFGDSGE